MSQAKVHRAAKARKKWTCGKCGVEVQVGEPVLSFSVGFRGREQRRCDKRECYPTRSERESSMIASVYDTLDNVDWNKAGSVEDLQELLQEVADSMREVAGEYESSEMYERNEDLQERVQILNDSAQVLEDWEPEPDEPREDDKNTWDDHESYDAAHEAWLEIIRQDAQETADQAELP